MRSTVLIAAVLIAGCDLAKPYQGLSDKNLVIRTASTGAKIVMGVESLDSRCAAQYEGSIPLDRPLVEVGLPRDRASRLVFEFHSPGLLASTSIKKEVQLLPRSGYYYEARISYKDEVYGVELREIDPRTGAVRDLDPRGGC